MALKQFISKNSDETFYNMLADAHGARALWRECDKLMQQLATFKTWLGYSLILNFVLCVALAIKLVD